MTPEQVFGKLNKDIKGLTSGVASASVSGSSIIFTMNDGSTQTITFPQPKDGASIVAVSTNENNQFVFSMSDGTEIVGGEVPTSSGVSKEYVDSELSKKANNSDIPTKVSGLQNDSNYQTDTDVATALTPYAKSADVTKEITNKVAEIVADAPEDFNTLKEMSDWISNHENDASAMNSAISDNKTAITALQTDKADKSEIPTELPANGGNASTVNGHTVNSDVPENAVFTDTTYSDATQIEHGLMSVDDKKKLDGLKKYTPDGSTITADEDGTLHGVKVIVDDAISDTSTNPLQNKVVKAYVDENVDFSTSTSKLLNDTKEATLVLSKATRNLLNPTLLSIAENDLKDSGVTAKVNSDGSITLNGTATRSIWSVLYTTYGSGKNNMFEGLRVFSNLNYNESGAYGELYIAYCRDNDGRQETWRSGHDGDLIPDGNGEPCWVRLHITSGATFNNETFFIMLTDDEEGAVNDKLIPYSGYDIKTCGKNLANVDMPTKTNNGVVCTNNGDGTYTLNGTATAEASFALVNNRSELYKRIVGKNILFLNGGHKWSRDYRILFNVSNSDFTKWGTEKYDGDSFVVPSGYEKAIIDIHISSGVTVNNLVVKPMITFDLEATNDDFESYQDGGTAHIDSSTKFPLLGLKSFDGETNIISPGNVEVTYAKSDSGKAILDTSEKFVKDARKETTVNLLKLTLQTTTQNGITCTNNGDGTYTLNGTATTQTTFIFANADATLAVFKGHSSLKLVGFPKKYASAGVLQVWRQSDNLIMRDRGDGVIITGSNMPYGNCNMAFVIYNGAVTDGMIIKPMLTTNLNATYDDFVPYTGDSGSLNWDVAELKDGKADKSKVADVNWTSVDISSVDENTNAGATINYCIKNGICYMSILNIGFKTASQAIILGDNSIPKPSSDYCLCPLVCVADPSYSVLIHPNLSGGLEHNVVGLTNQVYSGLFSYPVAES